MKKATNVIWASEIISSTQVSVGLKVVDEFGNTFTVVPEDFINSPENKDVWTCTPDYVEQELNFGRMTILNR